MITKHKLVEPILSVVMPILCTKSDEEEEEEEDVTEESNSLVTASTRLIDSLAINLPPEKLLAPLVSPPLRHAYSDTVTRAPVRVNCSPPPTHTHTAT